MILEGQCIKKTETWAKREHDSHPYVKTETCEFAYTAAQVTALKKSHDDQVSSLSTANIKKVKDAAQAQADVLATVIAE